MKYSHRDRIIAIIPARGGSKRIHRKNVKRLAGRPLIYYSIEQAIMAERVDRVYVSTEDEEIASLAFETGAEVIKRPDELAQDVTPTEDVVLHALQVIGTYGIQPEIVVLLQPTSPLRYPHHIDEAVELLEREEGDSLLSVCENDKFLWLPDKKPLNYDYKNRPRSQEKEWELVENGSIYITKTELYLKEKNRLGGKILFYRQPPECAFEIDTLLDWEIMEFLMRRYYVIRRYGSYLSKIRCFMIDVDGVLTNGGVYYDVDGERLLRFDRQDGKGVELLKAHGYVVGVISSEDSSIVKKRLEKIGVDFFYLGCRDKGKLFSDILRRNSWTEEEILFIGDDIQDLEIMRRVGFSAAPANAVEMVKRESMYVCEREGGRGAVREVVDLLLRCKDGGVNEYR